MSSDKHLLRTMQITDLPMVCAIHQSQFPHARSTRLGLPFTRKMYTWFIKNQPELCFVAEQEGNITGFLVGTIGSYGRRLFRFALPEIMLGILMHPAMILQERTYNLWNSFLKGLLPRYGGTALRTPEFQIISASLSSIAVTASAQGIGIGTQLVEAFEKGARWRGAKRLTLSVDMDNLPARRLYERCGWRMDREFAERNSVHYSKELSD